MKSLFIKVKYLCLIILFILIISFLFLFIFIVFNNTKQTNITSSIPSPTIQNKVLSQEKIDRIKNIYNSKEKIAYLTFDDGPTKRCTPKILDILKRNNITATFFVIGSRVNENPDIIKREYEEGNFIANHTYSHRSSTIYNGENTFLNELLKTDQAISNAIGAENYCSHLFRFPCGSKTNYSVKKKYINYLDDFDYTYLDWNCVNNDSLQKLSNYELLNNLKKTSKGKDTLVILMHDSGDVNKTYEVLQDSIDYLKNKGYEFRNMKDLIF